MRGGAGEQTYHTRAGHIVSSSLDRHAMEESLLGFISGQTTLQLQGIPLILPHTNAKWGGGCCIGHQYSIFTLICSTEHEVTIYCRVPPP